MYVKHLGADMKLHRARQLLKEIERLRLEYLTSDQVGVETAPAADGGCLAVRPSTGMFDCERLTHLALDEDRDELPDGPAVVGVVHPCDVLLHDLGPSVREPLMQAISDLVDRPSFIGGDGHDPCVQRRRT